MAHGSDIENLISGGRPELADLMNEPEAQRFLRRYRDIMDRLRGPSIVRDLGAAADNSLSSGIVGLDGRRNCQKLAGLARCQEIEAGSVDHESCVCAGIPMWRAEK